MTRLSVNLNKIALLRNSRGGTVPSVTEAARIAIEAGAEGITVHPRPDGRHIRVHDVYELSEMLNVEFNIEGNPTAEFMQLVLDVKPDQATLVPDGPAQLTSDHGWDVVRDGERLREIVGTLKDAGIRVSVFMDPVVEQIARVKETGADRIELYTESYAKAFGTAQQERTIAQFIAGAECAQRSGLGVNAGHDLNQINLPEFVRRVPKVLEVSIGHALISEAIFEDGLANVVRKYLDAIREGASV